MTEGERSVDPYGVMEVLVITGYELGEHCQGPPPIVSGIAHEIDQSAGAATCRENNWTRAGLSSSPEE
jgi:hypothetical protein